VSRSSFYAKGHPQQLRGGDLELMKRIDELYLKYPFLGSRKMAALLQREGQLVGRRRARRLMRKMGLVAVGPKPNTSQRHPGHKVYPYLLRGMAINRPNQVWATDITYIPMARGFMYLVAIIDWYSRKVLAWRVSNTLETGFCVEAVEEAMQRYGRPEIFNTDQGSQFTAEAFTSLLKRNGIRISMDGRGRALDNVFVERLWRTVKYEYVYLHAFDNGQALYRGLKEFFAWYNGGRPHQGLDYRAPDEVYAGKQLKLAA
jgi:putative transposase